MRLKNIQHLPVVDSKFKKIIGIVALFDIIEKYMIFPRRRAGGSNVRKALSSPSKERDLLKLPIGNEMTKNVITVLKSDTVKRVITLMCRHDIASVVVESDEKPVGIITIRDLIGQVAAGK